MDECLGFLITKLLPHFFRNAATTKEETVGSEHLAQLVDDVVCDETIETLQEHSSQSVRHEVYKSNAEHLHSIHIVPARVGVKVEATVHLLQDVA